MNYVAIPTADGAQGVRLFKVRTHDINVAVGVVEFVYARKRGSHHSMYSLI